MSGEHPTVEQFVDRLTTAIVDVAVLESMELHQGVDTTDPRVRETTEYFAGVTLRALLELADRAGRASEIDDVFAAIYLMWASHGETEREENQ